MMYLKILLVSFLALLTVADETEAAKREKARLVLLTELSEASILFNDKKYEEARADYTRIMEKYKKEANSKLLEPGFLDNCLLHAQVGTMDSLARLKRKTEALKLFPVSKTAKPSVNNYILAAETALLNRDREGCAAELKKAVALDPNAYYAHYMLGVVANSFRKYDEAIVHLKKSIETNEEYPDSYYLIGNIYLRQAEKKAVKKYWGAYLKLVPAHGDRYEFVKGTLHKMGGA